jgi:hypothetical protein
VEAVTPLNLKALALDIVEGKVFGSWQLHNPEKELSMVFMSPLFANKEDLPSDIGAVYEYLVHASNQSINSMPIFYSCRFLTTQQYKNVYEYVKEAQEHRKSFLQKNAKEPKTYPAGHSQPADSNQQLDSRRGASGSDRDDSCGSESSDDPASNRLLRLFKRKSGSSGFTSKARDRLGNL